MSIRRRRTVRVQGGATLGDLDRETHAFGLAVPCGIVPKTGIGGLTLGGGVGWLVRKYGMTIDNLLSCQIVTADGKVLTASRFRERGSLLGASGRRRKLRSGRVVRVPGPSGPDGPGWPAAVPARGRRGCDPPLPRLHGISPDELTAYTALLHGPDGAPLVGVIPCYCGEIVEGQRILEPLRTFGSPGCRHYPGIAVPRDAGAARAILSGWQSQLLEVDAAAGIVRRCDRRDCRACEPHAVPSVRRCPRILRRRRGPGCQRCHGIPASCSFPGASTSSLSGPILRRP